MMKTVRDHACLLIARIWSCFRNVQLSSLLCAKYQSTTVASDVSAQIEALSANGGFRLPAKISTAIARVLHIARTCFDICISFGKVFHGGQISVYCLKWYIFRNSFENLAEKIIVCCRGLFCK